MANWYDDVPAPVDSNDREVPLDTKELVFDGERREVYCFIYNIGRGGWSVGFKGSCGAALSACTLPDSWERIADELDEQADSLTKDGYTWQEDAIHDFADRIRKLRGED